MNQKTNTDKPELGNTNTSRKSIHLKFEVQLLIREIIGEMPERGKTKSAWQSREQHISTYLNNYHARHNALPFGCHDLGNTKLHNLEVGVIDFDTIRQKIDADLESKDSRNSKDWDGYNEIYDMQIIKMIMDGVEEQARGIGPEKRFYQVSEWIANSKRKLTDE